MRSWCNQPRASVDQEIEVSGLVELNSVPAFGHVAQRERASAFEAEGCRVEPCGYTVRGRAVTTTNATHTSDMNPKPTTSNMSMVLPEERASPLREMGSARAGRLPLFVNCAAWMIGPAGEAHADATRLSTNCCACL